jgi:hypothetical protein
MIERFKTYIETLEGLSTEALDESVVKLVRGENRNTALVIAHLAEMSRRKGALERGYKNLFDYAMRRLNLSEGSVALRLQVANVSRRFPQLLAAIAENRLSLTVAGLLAPHLSEVNVDQLLSECERMTKREAEEQLVAGRPKPVFTPSMRMIPTSIAEPLKEAPAPAPPPRTSPAVLQPATPTTFNFRFAADRDFKEKFERLAEVLGVENPLQHMAEILEKAVDLALEKKDPRERLQRRKEGHARKKSRPDEISRYISPEVRERVHERGEFQCEYRSLDGRRCTSRTGLQIEHARPLAKYRSHDERFLELFCPAHNRLAAETVYGREFIESKIAVNRAAHCRARYLNGTS